jgi:glycosyltransferase involved in cell wall biosynthesis
MATALVAFSGYGREPDVSTPVVSVVITFLDTPAGFLEEAVASVEAQTFRDWELLLVNDGSGPQSTRQANAIAARSPERIR